MSTKLNKGDIIIFKAGNDWLSKSIAWLTNSDVSHAAMVYSENSIIEVGGKGIGIHKVNISNGQEAYVMRLQPNVDSAPLIHSADKYFKNQIQYDFPALFLLAGLLVRKKMTPTAKLISITNRILSSVCLELDKYIQKAVLHHQERAMVCSQLVYQIFYDCGGKYRIQINENNKFRLMDASNSATVCLQDLAENLTDKSNIIADIQPSEKLQLEQDNSIDDEDIKELYTTLCESKEIVPTIGKDFTNSIPNLQDSSYYARIFIDKTKKIMSLLGSNLPIDAMFVTPADFVYHASNLKKQGMIELKRILDSN